MAREVKEITIGPHVYRVTPMGARQGEAYALQIAKVLAPTAAAFAEGVLGDPTSPEAESQLGALTLGGARALRQFVRLIEPAELAALQMELAKLTTVQVATDAAPLLSAIFDDHFAARYDWLHQWFAFALEVNFRSFFAGTPDVSELGKRLNRLVSAMSKSATPSPSATGPSTASSPASPTEAQA